MNPDELLQAPSNTQVRNLAAYLSNNFQSTTEMLVTLCAVLRSDEFDAATIAAQLEPVLEGMAAIEAELM